MVNKKEKTYESPAMKQSSAAVNQVLCQSVGGAELTSTIKSLGNWQ